MPSRFPSIDFHSSSQRLAVGTSEGAIVMYDLKSAIRLYVLEGHKHDITACSFSSDGRRLVTVSLEEGVALVWKVGSSLVSFFNPGAPPAGSEPFRRFPFVAEVPGDCESSSVRQWVLAHTFLDASNSSAGLDLVKIEWPGDRNVRLRIQETTLSFST